MLDRLLKLITSLKLTVVTLCFSLVLVFVGTMAQDPLGLYIAQERFFHSLFVDFTSMRAALEKTMQMFGVYVAAPTTGADVMRAPWVPVFPGGYLLGTILLVNLIASHFTRFKWTWAKSGIFMTHAGLILLLMGQLFADVFSSESSLQFEEGETKNYSADFRVNELVLTDVSHPEHDVVHSIPESRLARRGTITDPSLPFTIEVREYWRNADFISRGDPGFTKVDADQGIGPKVFVKPLAPVTAMDQRNFPAAVIELKSGPASLGKWFVTCGTLKEQEFQHAGKDWKLAFRFKRHYTPYSITLLEARHDKYQGTEIPRNFSSLVRLRNPATGEERQTKIYMNNPLRYGGKTYYQYQMAADEMMLRQGLKPNSTLQVVKNPSWLAPYLACAIVAAGLCVQFLIHLVKFARKPRKA